MPHHSSHLYCHHFCCPLQCPATTPWQEVGGSQAAKHLKLWRWGGQKKGRGSRVVLVSWTGWKKVAHTPLSFCHHPCLGCPKQPPVLSQNCTTTTTTCNYCLAIVTWELHSDQLSEAIVPWVVMVVVCQGGRTGQSRRTETLRAYQPLRWVGPLGFASWDFCFGFLRIKLRKLSTKYWWSSSRCHNKDYLMIDPSVLICCQGKDKGNFHANLKIILRKCVYFCTEI